MTTTEAPAGKVVRVAGYVVWFSFCFVVAVVVTFPLDGFKPLLLSQAETALGKGKQGPHGTDPVVTIESLRMSGLGVKAKRVHVQLGSKDPDPGAEFDIDDVVVYPPLLSLLSKNKNVSLDASLYGGDVSAAVSLDEKMNVIALDASIDGVDLAKVPVLLAELGVPLEGKIDADIELDTGKAAEKDAAGHVELDVKGLALGAGNLKKVPGGFEIADAIRLGNLKARMPIKQGVGTIESLKLEGTPDVEAEVTGTLSVKSRLQASRLDADGWFRPTAPFLEKNGKIKSALELGEKLSLPGAPSLGKAKDDEGRYHFSARGALQQLQPALAKDQGKKAKAKASKGTPTPVAPPPVPTPDEDAPKDE